MTSKERFYATMNYTAPDRAPTYYSGNPVIDRKLKQYFGVDTHEALIDALGNDFYQIAPVYQGPELRKFEDGSNEGIWGERYKSISFGAGEYVEAIDPIFENVNDLEQLDSFRFPSVDWYDYSTVRDQCERHADKIIYAGNPGMPDLINGIARFRGVEKVLLDIGYEDPVYLKLMDIKTDFTYDYLRSCLEAADGRIDVVWLGEDLGAQNGPLMSMDKYKRLFLGKHKRLIDLAHEFGAKAMMHCCGSCRMFIPTLIEAGLDILDVVQVNAADMDIRGLHRDFYKKIAFSGSISSQSTMAFGSIQDIIDEVELRRELFSEGGMIISTSNAIQDDTPVEKVLALYRAIGSLKE